MLALLPYFWNASFRIGEFKLMLFDWLTVFACPRAILFSCILNDLQKGRWLLAIQFGLHQAVDMSSFSHPPSPWLSWIEAMLQVLWAGMDSFPFTDLLSFKNILRQFLGPSHRFAHFFLRGLSAGFLFCSLEV